MLAGSSVIPSVVVDQRGVRLDITEQHLMHGHRQFVRVLAERKGQTALRVQIDEQHSLALSAIAAPSEATVVVLATPPFWLATASIRVSSQRRSILVARRLTICHPASVLTVHAADGVSVRQNPRHGLHDHRLVLLRHGETEWSKSGQHTGRTDLELTDTGRVQAELAGRVLRELKLADPLVISSPRIRALTTAKLAGLAVDEVSATARRMGLRRLRGVDDPADPGIGS